MPNFPFHAEQLTRRAPALALVRLAAVRPVNGVHAKKSLLAAGKSAGLPVSILGIYPGTEDYGG
jgi:hypothetical protein